MEEPTMAYVAKAKCGCLMMATIDNPEHKREVAKEVAKALRLGETVDHITLAALRDTPLYCDVHGPKKEATP